jgi:hypothetical protein
MKHVFITIAAFYIWLPSHARERTGSFIKLPPASVTDTIPYATLYVYRQKHWGGAHVSYDLHIEDSIICRVRNDSKYIIKLYKEGKTIFWAKTEKKATKEIDIKYGMAYYLKCDVTTSGVFVMRPTLQLMYTDYGEFDFKGVEGKNSAEKD